MNRTRHTARSTALPLLAAGLLATGLPAQQVADTAFVARVTAPAFAHGSGPVAVFGEAAMFSAMFSAQVAGPQRNPMGMNDPAAPQNAQFLLNVMHWLSGLLPAEP